MMPLLYIKVDDDDDDDDDDDVRTHNKNVMLCKEGSQSVVVGKSRLLWSPRVFSPEESLLLLRFCALLSLCARACVCTNDDDDDDKNGLLQHTQRERDQKRQIFRVSNTESKCMDSRVPISGPPLSKSSRKSAFVKGT